MDDVTSDSVSEDREVVGGCRAEATALNEVPDFERYYGSKVLSDVDVCIWEESTDAEKCKRDEGMCLPGHGMVLVAYSGYCRAKIESWDQATSNDANNSSANMRQIQMCVPAGQLEAGQLLLKGLYQRRPAVSALSPAQLLQLLMLADRYEVPKVVQAVGEQLASFATADLSWDTMQALYNLPAGCVDIPAYSSAYQAAAAKLQAELGDLELVWSDYDTAEQQGSKQRLLCDLPYVGLKCLLQDSRTRVASENTVFHTIQQWYDAQQEKPSQEEIAQLLKLIRMQHCTQLCVATVLSESPLAVHCFTQRELRLACLYSSEHSSERTTTDDKQSHRRRGLNEGGSDALIAYPMWKAAARPRSEVQQLVLPLDVHLSTLRELVQSYLDKKQQNQKQAPKSSHSKCSAKHVWQGRLLQMDVMVTTELGKKSDSVSVCLTNYLTHCPASDADSLSLRCNFQLVNSDHKVYRKVHEVTAGYSNRNRHWGADVFGPFKTWEEASQTLVAHDLVHADGCVHFKCAITELS